MEPEEAAPSQSTQPGADASGSGGAGADAALPLRAAASGAFGSTFGSGSMSPSEQHTPQQQQPGAAGGPVGVDPSLPALPKVATKPALQAAGSRDPVQCVLLRAAGFLSLLSMDEGTGEDGRQLGGPSQ